jgi:hypothetical protein
MSWNIRLLNLAAVMVVLAFAGTVRAQVTTGTISGTVTDPNGAVVNGATVKATNLETNATRETTSDSDGHFAFTLMTPGMM